MAQAPRNSSTPKKRQRPLQPCPFSLPIAHLAGPAKHKEAKPSITSVAKLDFMDMYNVQHMYPCNFSGLGQYITFFKESTIFLLQKML